MCYKVTLEGRGRGWYNTEKAHLLFNCLGLVVKHLYFPSIAEDHSHCPTLMRGAGKWSLTVQGKDILVSPWPVSSTEGDVGVKIWKMEMSSSGRAL